MICLCRLVMNEANWVAQEMSSACHRQFAFAAIYHDVVESVFLYMQKMTATNAMCCWKMFHDCRQSHRRIFNSELNNHNYKNMLRA